MGIAIVLAHRKTLVCLSMKRGVHRVVAIVGQE